MHPRVCALRALLLLSACVPSVAHIWFPDGWVQNASSPRGLTTSDCTSNTSPQWTSGPSSMTTFESYHLHLAWAAGNTAQAAAVTSFKNYLISVAGASSSCPNDLSDTSTYFCYSQTINSYNSSSKQDPFYNQDMFIFVGTSFFKSAMSFAMRCVRLRPFRRTSCCAFCCRALHNIRHSPPSRTPIPLQLSPSRPCEYLQRRPADAPKLKLPVSRERGSVRGPHVAPN